MSVSAAMSLDPIIPQRVWERVAPGRRRNAASALRLTAGGARCTVAAGSGMHFFATRQRLMRTEIVTAAMMGTVILTASALAVPAKPSVVFMGVTSERPINGYKATVRFAAPAGRRVLRNFVFETLGCFGSGAFPVGVDPYFESPWRVKAIPVNKKGVYSAKVTATSPAADSGTLTATIKGSFRGARKAIGKITFSQEQGGAECGPQTIKFTAVVSTS
jgi:hypothetical protein